MSIDRWMDKEDVVLIHIYNGILLSHKKEWNNAIYSNIDGLRDYHTKWSKSERERQIPYITYMWNLKYDTWIYLPNRNRLRHREQACGCQGREGVGEGWIGSLGLAGAKYYI